MDMDFLLSLFVALSLADGFLIVWLVKNRNIWPRDRQLRIILIVNCLSVGIGIIGIVGGFFGWR